MFRIVLLVHHRQGRRTVVGTPFKSDVVDFVPGTDFRIGQRGAPVLSARLAQADFGCESAQAAFIRVDRQLVGIHAVEVSGRRLLGLQDRFRGAVDPAGGEGAAERPVAIIPVVFKIDAAQIGRFVEKVFKIGPAQVAVDRAQKSAEDGVPVVQVLLGPGDQVVGGGFDRKSTGKVRKGARPVDLVGRGLLDRVGIQQADRPTVLRFAAQLGGRGDGRLQGDVGVDGLRVAGIVDGVVVIGVETVEAALRRAPDSPGIEGDRVAERVERFRVAKLENFVPLQEEGSLFREKCFESAEVDHRRVGLDLPEVRVDGGGQRQVGGESVFQVGPQRTGQLILLEERVRRFQGRPGQAGGGVGIQFKPFGRFQFTDPFQPPVLRHKTGCILGRGRPERDLLFTGNSSLKINAPASFIVLLVGTETELRQRYFHLHRPAALIHAGRGFPDGIPSDIFIVVIVDENILSNPFRIYREGKAGALVVVAVDIYVEPVAVGRSVFAKQRGSHRIHRGIVRPGPDIDRIGGVDYPRLRLFGGGAAVVRRALRKPGRDRSLLPDRFV